MSCKNKVKRKNFDSVSLPFLIYFVKHDKINADDEFEPETATKDADQKHVTSPINQCNNEAIIDGSLECDTELDVPPLCECKEPVRNNRVAEYI